MECEEYKKRYGNLLLEESSQERFDKLENLINEGINKLPKEHAAYFLCEILQNMDGLTNVEYDLFFGHVMSYFFTSATTDILLLSSIDLELCLALAKCPGQNMARSYYGALLDWYRDDLEKDGKFHASAISICIGLSSMLKSRSLLGEEILTYLYEAVITGIKDHDEQLMICEQILSTLNQWNTIGDLMEQVKKHVNAIRS
jgi:hypothetical protein